MFPWFVDDFFYVFENAVTSFNWSAPSVWLVCGNGSIDYNPSNPEMLLFGMSSSLNDSVGIELLSGIRASFEKVNLDGGILGGITLNLTVRDDFSDSSECLNNTELFLNDSEVFALIGYMGSQNIDLIKPNILYEGVPLIGTFSGSMELRTDSNREFVNLRASFDDELSSIVHYAVRKRKRFSIAILRSNDTFGESCYTSLEKSLDAYGLEISCSSIVDSSITDQNVEDIFSCDPEALIIIGDAYNLAYFVKEISTSSNYSSSFPSLLVFTVSGVGTVLFAEYLYELDVPLDSENIFVTEVLPNIFDDSFAEEYETLLSNYESSLELIGVRNMTFTSFEGYLVGRLVIEIFSALRGSLTRDNFLEAVYSRSFFIDFFKVGPYELNECNQGLREIWFVNIQPDYQFVSVTEAELSWSDTCISDLSVSMENLVFKQSCALTGGLGPYGVSFQEGIRASFEEYNLALPSYMDRMIQLDSLDDMYNPDLTENNTLLFLSENNTFSFIGFIGTPTTERIKPLLLNNSHLSYIGAYTGSDLLREPGMDSFINVRPGYFEEVMAITQILLNEGYTRFSCLYQNDAFGYSGYDGLKQFLDQAELDLVSEGTYERSTYEIDDAYMSIMAGNPEVIVFIAVVDPTLEFIRRLLNETESWHDMKFVAISVVATGTLIDGLYYPEEDYENSGLKNLYVTSVMPDFMDTSLRIVEDFQNAVTDASIRNSISFEGYVVGKIVTHILEGFSREEMNNLTSQVFLDEFYKVSPIDFYDGEIYFGPLVHSEDTLNSTENTESCNCGLRKIYLTRVLEDLSISYFDSVSFTTCRADFSSLLVPIRFGHTYDFSDEKNLDLSLGFQIAVDSKEEELTSLSKSMLLLRSDDQSLLTERNANIEELESKMVLAFIALDGHHQTEVPVIGMIRPDINTRDDDNFLHLRPFLYDEVRMVIKYFEDIKARETLLVVSDIESSIDLIMDSYKELSVIRVNELRLDDGYYIGLGEEIISLHSDKKLILFSTTTPITSKLMIHHQNEQKIAFLGLNDYVDLYERFNRTFPEFYYTLPYPRSQHSYVSFIEENEESIRYPDYAYYGYVIGSLLAENYISYSQSSSSTQNFMNNFFVQEYFNIDNDLVIGPFQSENCNLGFRTLYLYYDNEVKHSEVIISGCTNYNFDQFPIFYLLFSLFTTSVCVSICYICFCSLLVLYFVSAIRKSNIQPEFDGNCVVGFTDIQNSSKLWKDDQKTMNDALKIHNRICRKSIKKYNGKEIKFIGDSFLIIWNNIDEAVHCCLDIQEKLLKARWPPKLLEEHDARVVMSQREKRKILFTGLRVRIGINYCESVNPVFDNNRKCFDYVADEINQCARIEGVALGGQVCAPKKLVEMYFRGVLDDYDDKEQRQHDKISRCVRARRFGRFELKGTGEEDIWEFYSSRLEERIQYYDKSFDTSKHRKLDDDASSTDTASCFSYTLSSPDRRAADMIRSPFLPRPSSSVQASPISKGRFMRRCVDGLDDDDDDDDLCYLARRKGGQVDEDDYIVKRELREEEHPEIIEVYPKVRIQNVSEEVISITSEGLGEMKFVSTSENTFD